VLARLPARLQFGNIRVENAVLARVARHLRKDVTGHILAHGLATDMPLAGNLDDGTTFGLQLLDLRIARVALCTARLLPNLILSARVSRS
jgi:hypothetical protein